MNRYRRLQISLFCLSILGLFLLGACGRNEIRPNEVDKQDLPSLQIPLEEIAERIEYEYIYENMIDHIADYDYKQLSFLPLGEDIDVSFYTIEGNKLLFLPEEKANTEVVVNGEMCNLYYCKEACGYVFYVLVDWQLSEQGVPVNSLEGDYYHRIRECIVRDKDAVYEEIDLCDSPIYFSYEFVSDDLVKLGEAKVTFDPEATIALPEIAVDDNECIDAVVEYAASLLREGQEYGEFQICLETYGRVQEKYDGTRCKISVAVIGETLEDYLFFSISDLRGKINEDFVSPEYYPARADSPTYFVDESYLETEPEDRVKCPVHVNREGKMEFYQLNRNEYAGGKGQLKTTFFMENSFPTKYAEDMVWLGEAEFTLQELPSLDVAEIEEDEYISALKKHIEDVLQQNGRRGTYEMMIGEYEGIHINTVCLSAAVCGGEESYYFRYMIVKSEKGNYYFWPVGFGLNGSLEESEAQRHYMNALCIERTKQLDRNRIEIEID